MSEVKLVPKKTDHKYKISYMETLFTGEEIVFVFADKKYSNDDVAEAVKNIKKDWFLVTADYIEKPYSLKTFTNN